MKFTQFFFTCCLPALLNNTVSGQYLSSFQNIKYINGFPQNTIQAIHKDKKGYLWLGTESGLSRYDGKRITNYKIGHNNNFTLTGKTISNITGDKSGNLWVSSDLGLTLFSPDATPEKNEILKAIQDKINSFFPDTELETVKILGNGNVMLGYRTGLVIYNVETGRSEQLLDFIYKGKKITPYIVNVHEDGEKQYIITTATDGIFILNQSYKVTSHIVPESFGGDQTVTIVNSLLLPGRSMFLASYQGLFRIPDFLNPNPVKVQDQAGVDLSGQFNCLSYDTRQNHILAGSNLSGVMTFDTTGILKDHFFDSGNNKRLLSNNIYYLLTDDEGPGYWIGTGKGLLKLFYAENRLLSLPIKDNKESPLRTYPIYTENNEDLLIGTERLLLKYNLRLSTQKIIPVENNADLRYNYIFKAADDLYLFCTKQGLYFSESIAAPILRKISYKFPELKFLDSAIILCGVVINENEILFGLRSSVSGDLVRWNRSKRVMECFIHRPNMYSLDDFTVNFIAPANDEKFYICTNGGLYYFDNRSSACSPFLLPGKGELNYPQVNAIFADKNTLWIGTYGGGLNKYTISPRKVEYITEKEGIASNDIYAILRSDEDHIWLSTNGGIVCYNTKTSRIRNYDMADGVINNEFNRTSFFKHNDTLYFGGISGINFFDSRAMLHNSNQPFADISGISLLNGGDEILQFVESNGSIKTTYSKNTFKFYLSSPFYINPAKTTFKYRLLPNQEEWISNGTNNELILSQLPPGKHTLEVKSVSSEGIESYNTKQLFITITPPWYQTTLFKLSVGLFVTGILYSFYRLRLNRIKKEQQIRNQLASDLHDDLGSTLNSIKVHSNLALLEKENPEHLYHVKQGAQDAISGVRDIIWVLDDKKDKLNDMLARVSQFAAPLCHAANINYKTPADDETASFVLGKEEKRNLYMICKESINNSIKYAGCKNIDLKVSISNKKMKLIITDDGRGFDKGKITAGNGLKNIAARAKAIQYHHKVISSTGGGTVIELEKA